MKVAVLLVNYDDESLQLYIPLLADNGITARTAPSMQDALVMLMDIEYSCVVINGDRFDYLPLLKVMRQITKAPLCVSVSRYRQDENHDAIRNGANIYRVRFDSAENRVERFADFVKIYAEYITGQQQPLTVLTHGELQIFPTTRKIYVQGVSVHLLPKEFDVLHYFMINKGINLSHSQILRRVWGDEYADGSRTLLYTHISRLRRKLQPKPDMPDYITTIRKYGYVFAPE
ncbi:response regulator transcription factor [Ruminococcaceae bacterium OttesenSCG-928-A11]|nr:response regulator transcription factor [Ruminococcaceae bacterium OttesenSCG-928-A11]